MLREEIFQNWICPKIGYNSERKIPCSFKIKNSPAREHCRLGGMQQLMVARATGQMRQLPGTCRQPVDWKRAGPWEDTSLGLALASQSSAASHRVRSFSPEELPRDARLTGLVPAGAMMLMELTRSPG